MEEPWVAETLNEQDKKVEIDPVKLQVALEKFRSEQDFLGGVGAGLAAAIAGAIIWAVISAVTEYQIGWMAVGGGFLVGMTVRVVGKGIEKHFGIAGALLALFGCLLGNLITICYFIGEQENMGFLEVLAVLNPRIVLELMKSAFNPIDILFYALAVYEGYRFSFRTLTEQEVVKASKEGGEKSLGLGIANVKMKKQVWIGIFAIIIAMGLFSIFRRDKDIKEEELPWHNLPSIFGHIQSNLDSEGKLTEAGYNLPDEIRRKGDEKLRWAPGAKDGIIAQNDSDRDLEMDAKKVVELIKKISAKNALSEKVELYNILLKDNLIGFVDYALAEIVASHVFIDPYLHEYAKWLAFKSPDRGPVKFGIALLGLFGDQMDIDNIFILGKHEEFTLFSAVAIINIGENPEKRLWDLAQYVEGWGRIYTVERLAETQNPEIKKWLIREGYKNSIMYEYLAYTCAVAGNLKGELSKSEIDDELLNAAGDIIAALISGGPAKNIDDYEDAPEVIRLYVTHIKNRAEQLNHFLTLNSIQRFLEDENADWNERKENGWTEELKTGLLIDLNKIITNPKWKRIVLEKQNSTDYLAFWQVDRAATILGIDIWETHWKRLNDNPTESGLWYNVMKNANSERIDQIITLAIKKIPLDQIATGPADELGLGKEYKPHSCLDYLLQDLGKYPNKGYELIKTGLRSPVTRNRNMAIKALSAWGIKNWPEGTRELLELAEKEEPNADTKKEIASLLEGQNIE